MTATLATTTTDGGYPQGVLGTSRRQERRRTASSRTARIRTARPTRVGELVPALRKRIAAGDAVLQAGATMDAPPPPPTLGTRRGGPATGGPSAPPTGPRPPRERGASGAPSLSFEPLAIGAFFVVFFAPPIALFMAIASLRRAYQKGVSPVLSWIALLVSGFATVISLGIFAAVVDALSGLG